MYYLLIYRIPYHTESHLAETYIFLQLSFAFVVSYGSNTFQENCLWMLRRNNLVDEPSRLSEAIN